jgi:tRNA(Ile)-lysidine synthase
MQRFADQKLPNLFREPNPQRPSTMPHLSPERVFEVLPLPKWQRHTVLLGVSGGADSVAMLRIVHEITQNQGLGKVIVCHANHQMRGQDSQLDQQFVEQLCDQLQLECISSPLPLDKNVNHDGAEAGLRDLRYKLFREVATNASARYVMTAHTANDQAETILFRLMRGTGIAGLAGIPQHRRLCDGVTLVRPLLNIERSEILDYLDGLGQPFRTDSSNAELTYSRNKVRHQLIPLMQTEFNCDLNLRLEPLTIQAKEYQELLDHLISPLQRFVTHESDQSVSIATELSQHPSPLVRHLLIQTWKEKHWPLQSMTFAKWQQLADFLQPAHEKGQSSELTLPGKIQVSREGEQVTLRLKP